MMHMTSDIKPITTHGYFGPATLLDVQDDQYRVALVSDNPDFEDSSLWARSALLTRAELCPGDIVLLAGNNKDCLYIIGVINSRSPQEPLTLEDGTHVKVSQLKETQTLTVFSKEGDMLFEYDAKKRKTFVNIQKGDLEFVNKNGSIDFTAAKGIRLSSAETIEIKSLDNIKLVARKMETFIDTIMEKAKNVYRSVEKLTQLKTGRMRTLVKGTSHLKTKKAFYKAEEDFKIKGEKIHLG